MELSSDSGGVNFGFTDLHGFKDFIVLVYSCAPDNFFYEEWLRPDEQMNLDRAFVGLRFGLDLAAREKGESELIARCRSLVEEAYRDYQKHDDRAGQKHLEEVEGLIKTIPTE